MSISRKGYKRGCLAKIHTVHKTVPLSKNSSDITGRLFGKLKVLNYLGINHKRETVWRCRCECGSEVQRSRSYLTKNFLASCGCLTNNRIKSYAPRIKINCAEDLIDQLIGQYQRGAFKRGFNFSLDYSQCVNLFFDKCYYCGSRPNNEFKYRNFTLLYNGIDRLVNDKGYEIDNVLTCCKVCNRMKSNMSIEDFSEHLRNLKNRLNVIIKEKKNES